MAASGARSAGSRDAGRPRVTDQVVELLAFPLLGAGSFDAAGSVAAVSQTINLQSFLFAALCGAHMLVLRIIQELWQSSGGVFNVDEVLQQLSLGLEEELQLRMRGLQPTPNGEREQGIEVST